MKKENLEQVNRLVQKLGLLFQKVKEAFSAKVSKSSEILPGMYVYADGLISAKRKAKRQVKAVVGYVEGKTVYAVCLKKTGLSWSFHHLKVKASRNMISGKEATRKILAAAIKQRKNAEAVQWCYAYAEDGVIPGEAFLPSLEELEKLYANKEAINRSLSALNARKLDGQYLSSAEYDMDSACLLDMDSGDRGCGYKHLFIYYARPVIAIQL